MWSQIDSMSIHAVCIVSASGNLRCLSSPRRDSRRAHEFLHENGPIDQDLFQDEGCGRGVHGPSWATRDGEARAGSTGKTSRGDPAQRPGTHPDVQIILKQVLNSHVYVRASIVLLSELVVGGVLSFAAGAPVSRLALLVVRTVALATDPLQTLDRDRRAARDRRRARRDRVDRVHQTRGRHQTINRRYRLAAAAARAP